VQKPIRTLPVRRPRKRMKQIILYLMKRSCEENIRMKLAHNYVEG